MNLNIHRGFESHSLRHDTIMLFFIFSVVSYLLGSINNSIIICRICDLGSPSEYGSLNPGATNVLRLYGIKKGLLTFLFDFLKGFLTCKVLNYINYFTLIEINIFSLFIIIGHIYPIFFKFKGGKGIATFIGIVFSLNYIIGILYILCWLLFTYLTKYVSFSSLLSTLLIYLLMIFVLNMYQFFIFFLIILLIFISHISNIKRLINHNENKFKFKK